MLLLDVCLDEADGPLEVRCDDVVQRVAAVDEEVVDLLADVVWVRADGEDGGDVERAEGWLRRCLNRAEVDVQDVVVLGDARRGCQSFAAGDDTLRTVVVRSELVERACSARNGSIRAESEAVRRM